MPRKREDSPLPAKDWTTFPGFDAPHYTQTPDILFDEIMPYLTGAELKCLLYIVRRTLGFKKAADAIGIEQLTCGIVSRDGTRQDLGTGLARTSVLEAIRSLKDKQLIQVIEQRDASNGSAPSMYRLNLNEGGSTLERTPGVHSYDKGGTKERTPPVRKSAPTRNSDPRNNTRDRIPTAARDSGTAGSRYTRGRYAVCAVCHSRPHSPDCPDAPESHLVV